MSDNPVLAYGAWLAETPADFVDASFFKELEKSGMIEQLYRK